MTEDAAQPAAAEQAQSHPQADAQRSAWFEVIKAVAATAEMAVVTTAEAPRAVKTAKSVKDKILPRQPGGKHAAKPDGG